MESRYKLYKISANHKKKITQKTKNIKKNKNFSKPNFYIKKLKFD